MMFNFDGIHRLSSSAITLRKSRRFASRVKHILAAERLENRTLLAADVAVDQVVDALELTDLDLAVTTIESRPDATRTDDGSGLLGDANRDGRFDQLDLLQLTSAGKYLSGESASWSEGDWNGDRLFDQHDLVAALQLGHYTPRGLDAGNGNDTVAALSFVMDQANHALEVQGANYRVVMSEYITGGDEAGNQVLSKDVGNKRLSGDFVPFDERRLWSGPVGGSNDNITYAVDTTDDAEPPIGGLTAEQTDAAIDRAMGTWDSLECSDLDITRNPDFGDDIGIVAFINGLGGGPFVYADIQHAGWNDIDFVGGILAATFTFGFIDGDSNFTDIDNNGRFDVAFREIYYDPSFIWADDGITSFDVESLALHEAGHGLSQGHFGKVFRKADGELHTAPLAVMNALDTGPVRSLFGTDIAGHCGDWGQWPKN